MAGGFADKSAWKASKDALKTELNAGVKNPITKLFKRIGRVVTVGLEQIRPYDKKAVTRSGIGDKIKDLFRHPKFGIKQMAGYPMRIIIGMMVILPFLSKIAVKGSHVLFGKPKNSVLDEGKEAENTQTTVPQQPQLPPQLQQAVPQTAQTSQQQQSQSNLLNKYKSGNFSSNSTVSGNKNVNPQEPVRTYIPSPVGVKINPTEDLTAADAAMRRADLAEQQALQTLKMN